MAQSVLQHMVNERNLTDQFHIDFAATSREEIGNPVHLGTVRKLQDVGIPVIPHRAVQMTATDYDQYDYLIGMDAQNLRNMNRITGGGPEDKMRLLLAFTGVKRNITDPWYTGNFDETYQDVRNGYEALLRTLGF